MTDSPANAQAKAGAVLQAAREELSLTLDQVADELHLRPSVVKAIEDSNFDEFPSDVFLKGYFRTYCRLVNLHEERMMTLLDVQLDERKKAAEQKDQQANKLIQTKKRKKLFVTLLVFLVCISLVGLAYHLATQSESSAEPIVLNQTDSVENNRHNENAMLTGSLVESEAENHQGHSEISTVQSDTSTEESKSSELNEGPPNSQNSVSENETVSVGEATQVLENKEDLSNEIKTIKDQSIEAPVSEASTRSKSEQNGLQQLAQNNISQPLTQASLYAAFKGDCWFKVVDANGKTVIAALKKENTESRFTGIAPFHLIIGDASNVSLQFEGEQVDLAPYTARNGRAELTLRPSTPESEG